MKYYIVLALALIFSISAGAQDRTLTVPLSDPGKKGKLDIDIKRGSITVIGTDRSDVLIKYTIVEAKDDDHGDDDDDDGYNPNPKVAGKEHKKNKAKAGMKKIGNSSLDLEIGERNNKVYAHCSTWFKELNFTIEVPKNFDLKLEGYMGGRIDVKDVNGDITLENYVGEISATGVSGVVNATAYSGEISVDFKSIDAGKDMSFVNYTGDVTLNFPTGYKADFKMKTQWGDIYSDLDLAVGSTEPTLKKDESSETFKVYTDNWTRATLNGGGPVITIKSQTGSIYLSKK